MHLQSQSSGVCPGHALLILQPSLSTLFRSGHTSLGLVLQNHDHPLLCSFVLQQKGVLVFTPGILLGWAARSDVMKEPEDRGRGAEALVVHGRRDLSESELINLAGSVLAPSGALESLYFPASYNPRQAHMS